MGLGLGVIRLTTAAAGLVQAGPRLLARGAPAAAGAVAGTVAGLARAGVRGADTAVGVVRVVRNALPGDTGQWRSGARAHLRLRLAEPGRTGRESAVRRVAQASGKVAEALAERPDVVSAYWDGGLTRLVITAAGGEMTDGVVERAATLAEHWGLAVTADPEEAFTHPGDPDAVRTAATALAADVLGAGIAITGAVLRLPHTPRTVTAVVTLLRENPRFRTWLTRRMGRPGMDLTLALANAAAHTAGGTPTALVLDGGLRACELTERVARAVAFDATHDHWSGPERGAVPADHHPRPPMHTTPTQEYAAHTSVASVLGAVATELVKRDIEEAAEAVLAGSPKAARYGPAAFRSVLSGALARQGVLVREPDRLRHLELAETLVLHPSALLTPGGADPWVEAVLDAARQAGLRVVMVDHPALADFTGLADRVVSGERPLEEVVDELIEGSEGGTVVTVARPSSADQEDVLAGLLGSDVAIALTDLDGIVVWGADVLAPHGLPDAWRVLTAITAARGVVRKAQTLAKSGAALSGLLVAVRGARPSPRWPLPGLRHMPVDAAAAAALLTGVQAALGVAATPLPEPRPRIPWHALGTEEVQERLERRPEPKAEREPGRARAAAQLLARHPVFGPASAPVRWSVRLARAVRGELDDPLTPVLAVGSAASAILGSAVDALLVVGALDLNALVGGVQRLRAERALSGLVAEQQRKARLRRRRGARKPGGRGAARTVDAAELHQGDVIEVQADDVVPADARLL
ncbi:MAG: cation-translocating P-type ATPase, partial [Streptomyces sp.]|nr:cation-translocating P-type ATPase [Streptomyces sp.]